MSYTFLLQNKQKELVMIKALITEEQWFISSESNKSHNHPNGSLEPILSYCSVLMSELNRVSVNKLTKDLLTVLRDFSPFLCAEKNTYISLALASAAERTSASSAVWELYGDSAA
jgi:hypothetical protein